MLGDLAVVLGCSRHLWEQTAPAQAARTGSPYLMSGMLEKSKSQVLKFTFQTPWDLHSSCPSGIHLWASPDISLCFLLVQQRRTTGISQGKRKKKKKAFYEVDKMIGARGEKRYLQRLIQTLLHMLPFSVVLIKEMCQESSSSLLFFWWITAGRRTMGFIGA